MGELYENSTKAIDFELETLTEQNKLQMSEEAQKYLDERMQYLNELKSCPTYAARVEFNEKKAQEDAEKAVKAAEELVNALNAELEKLFAIEEAQPESTVQIEEPSDGP